ncbi:MAG: hypothetical protein ABJ004_02125 [Cyclobacteriaceae bacterium]
MKVKTKIWAVTLLLVCAFSCSHEDEITPEVELSNKTITGDSKTIVGG